jgi:hypothetical protein
MSSPPSPVPWSPNGRPPITPPSSIGRSYYPPSLPIMAAMKAPITATAHGSRPPPPPSRPYKRTPTLWWSTSPLLLPSSITPAPWPLGTEAPPSVRRLLADIRALARSPPVARRCARPVSTLTVNHRGPERPLGRAPASPCRRPRGESMVDPWTGHPGAGPRAMDRVHGISY